MNVVFRLAQILIFLIAFLLSCSDDPSSPKDEVIDQLPQDAVTIGVEGGTVVKDDLSITIPAGTFVENHEISIEVIVDDEAFGENAISASYKINGLPAKYAKPIEIKSKFSRQLNGDPFLAVGKSAINVGENDSSIVYSLYFANDSSSFLTSTIPAMSNYNLTKVAGKHDEFESLELFVKFLDNYAFTESDNFVIFFPLSAIQQVAKVKEMFEEAYGIVKHGLHKTFTEGLVTRTIVILSQEDPINVDLNTSINDYLIHEYNVSKESLLNQEYNDIQVRAVQELFYFTGRIGFQGEHWVVSAIYNWIEDWISDATNYIYPKYIIEKGLTPFWGFEGSDKSYEGDFDNNSEELGIRGRGMSGVIKYLSQLESFGLAGLGRYSWTPKSHTDQTSDLLDGIGIPHNEWWPDFIKQYVNNEIFKFPDGYFSQYTDASWDVNTENDTLKIFKSSGTKNYQDLSAKRFKIDLDYPEFDDSQNISFEINQFANNNEYSIILFSVTNGKPEYLQTSNSKNLEISNLKSFTENNGKQILVVVVNNDITTENLLGQSNIELKIEISSKKTEQIFDYNRCHVEVQFIAEIERGSNFGSSFETKLQSLGSSQMRGNIAENIYTGEFKYSNETTTSDYTLNVVLNETHDTVKTFIWKAKQIGPEDDMLTEQEISGINIPVNITNPSKFELSGPEICNISTIKYDFSVGEQFVRITDKSCDSESYIFLHFYKD